MEKYSDIFGIFICDWKVKRQETFLYIQRQADQRERVLLANAAACKKFLYII